MTTPAASTISGVAGSATPPTPPPLAAQWGRPPAASPISGVAGSATRPNPALLAVNVGLPRDVPWHGETVHTGVWKRPVPGPAMVRRLNIDGDGQGDTQGHGGEQ